MEFSYFLTKAKLKICEGSLKKSPPSNITIGQVPNNQFTPEDDLEVARTQAPCAKPRTQTTLESKQDPLSCTVY